MKYCSPECRTKYGKKQWTHYEETIKCAMCGEEFVSRHRLRMYCSDECRIKADRLKRNKEVTCTCGKKFIGFGKYCSSTCRAKNRKVYVGIKTCRICGMTFYGKANTRLCDECKKKPKKKKGDPIIDKAVEARKKGMSYGQLVALEYMEKMKNE